MRKIDEAEAYVEEQRRKQSEAMTDNLAWFIRNQSRLAHLYEGMYIVIKDCSVIATFHDQREAYDWTCLHFYDEATSIYQSRRDKYVYYKECY